VVLGTEVKVDDTAGAAGRTQPSGGNNGDVRKPVAAEFSTKEFRDEPEHTHHTHHTHPAAKPGQDGNEGGSPPEEGEL
jgi:hypothetical protein